MSGMRLTLTAPEVISVHGDRGYQGKNHLKWFVDYAPEPHENGAGRVVWGTIHASHGDVISDVTVAAFIAYDNAGEVHSEEFEEALLDSDALAALWDVTRISFGALTGLLENRITLPRTAPSATLSQLRRPSEAQEPNAGD